MDNSKFNSSRKGSNQSPRWKYHNLKTMQNTRFSPTLSKFNIQIVKQLTFDSFFPSQYVLCLIMYYDKDYKDRGRFIQYHIYYENIQQVSWTNIVKNELNK